MDEICHLSKKIRIRVHFECYICEYRMLNTTVQNYARSTIRKVFFCDKIRLSLSYSDGKQYLCDKYVIYMNILQELANAQTSSF